MRTRNKTSSGEARRNPVGRRGRRAPGQGHKVSQAVAAVLPFAGAAASVATIAVLAAAPHAARAATEIVNVGTTGDIGSASTFNASSPAFTNGTGATNGDTINLSSGAGFTSLSYSAADSANGLNSLASLLLNPNASGQTTAFNQNGGAGSALTIGSLILGSGTQGASRITTYNVASGTLNVSGVTFGPGASTGVNVLSGATFNYSSTGNLTFGPIAGSVSYLNVSGGTFNDTLATPTAALLYVGNVAGASSQGVVNVTNAGTFNVGTGTVVVGQFGTGSGTLNVSGGSTVTAGSIVIGNNNGASAESGTVNLTTGGTITANSFARGNSNVATGAIAFNANGGTVIAGATTANYFNAIALNVSSGGLTFNNGGFTVAFTPATLTGVGGLTEVGPGKVAVAVNATYTGGTTISGGTFQANTTGAGNSSTGTAASAVTIASGAVLAGGTKTAPGQVLGTVLVSPGATVTAGTGATPSDTVGTLSTGAETWTAGGQYLVKVNAGNITGTAAAPVATDAVGDQLIMSGLTVTSTAATPFTINLTSLGTTNLSGGAELVIATVPNASPGVFATVLGQLTVTSTNISIPPGSFLTLGEEDVAGSDDLVVTAAPEPASLMLAALAAAPLALVRRRRSGAAPPSTSGN